MPYLRRTEPHERSKRLLKGYDVTASRLSTILNCSETTARSRLRNPGTLSGDEWLLISKRGHVPIEEIREVFLS